MAETAQNHDQPDVGRQQVATVYAKAFLGAAEVAGKTEALLEELRSFVADVLARLPDFAAALASPRLTHEAKLGLLDRALAGRASPEFVNFLKVVSAHGRLDCLRAIDQAAQTLYAQRQGRVRVRVQTAEPLSAPLAGKVADALRGILKSEVDLVPEIEPDIIGGVVFRVGDTVYDGSVANQLDRLRGAALEKSLADMQGNLDRFLRAE